MSVLSSSGHYTTAFFCVHWHLPIWVHSHPILSKWIPWIWCFRPCAVLWAQIYLAFCIYDFGHNEQVTLLKNCSYSCDTSGSGLFFLKWEPPKRELPATVVSSSGSSSFFLECKPTIILPKHPPQTWGASGHTNSKLVNFLWIVLNVYFFHITLWHLMPCQCMSRMSIIMTGMICATCLILLVLPEFGSEPRFKPELLWTWLRSSLKFRNYNNQT